MILLKITNMFGRLFLLVFFLHWLLIILLALLYYRKTPAVITEVVLNKSEHLSSFKLGGDFEIGGALPFVFDEKSIGCKTYRNKAYQVEIIELVVDGKQVHGVNDAALLDSSSEPSATIVVGNSFVNLVSIFPIKANRDFDYTQGFISSISPENPMSGTNFKFNWSEVKSSFTILYRLRSPDAKKSNPQYQLKIVLK